MSTKMPTKMPSWRWRRRYCAWAGMVALVFQVAVSLGQGLTVSRTSGNAEIVVPFIICDLVGWGARFSPEDSGPSDPVSSYPGCPVCLVHALGLNLPAVEHANVYEVSDKGELRLQYAADQPAGKNTNTAGYPRAPPLAV